LLAARLALFLVADFLVSMIYLGGIPEARLILLIDVGTEVDEATILSRRTLVDGLFPFFCNNYFINYFVSRFMPD
jgi:hypothetical protein